MMARKFDGGMRRVSVIRNESQNQIDTASARSGAFSIDSSFCRVNHDNSLAKFNRRTIFNA